MCFELIFLKPTFFAISLNPTFLSLMVILLEETMKEKQKEVSVKHKALVKYIESKGKKGFDPNFVVPIPPEKLKEAGQ